MVDTAFGTCDSVTKMLVQVGMRSEWTLSGKEAVLRAGQSVELNDPFRAYIIDWRLPDMNGIEALPDPFLGRRHPHHPHRLRLDGY